LSSLSEFIIAIDTDFSFFIFDYQPGCNNGLMLEIGMWVMCSLAKKARRGGRIILKLGPVHSPKNPYPTLAIKA